METMSLGVEVMEISIDGTYEPIDVLSAFPTKTAVSSRHLAVGAESGVVNLYSEQTGYSAGKAVATTQNRKPIKSIMNLHTSADLVRFNGDGQILAMSTRREKNSLKLLHVPSGTVFSNWPTSKTPLNYVWSMDFSPESKFLAIGNDKGKCLLYRMMHYQD
jgi:U3 small nucleolar RNA-associated protein 18